jgi:hypothetical protein
MGNSPDLRLRDVCHPWGFRFVGAGITNERSGQARNGASCSFASCSSARRPGSIPDESSAGPRDRAVSEDPISCDMTCMGGDGQVRLAGP